MVVPAESSSGPGVSYVPFSVSVPHDAAPGDHAGGIVASLTSAGTGASGQRIVLVQRVGVRVFLRVAGPVSPALSIEQLGASYSGTANPLGGGDVSVSYLVRNTGDINLGFSQEVGVSAVIGDKHSVQLRPVQVLRPGTVVHEQAVLHGVRPAGLLSVKVTLQPIAAANSGVSGIPPVVATTSVFAAPLVLGGIVVVLVGALGLLPLFSGKSLLGLLRARWLGRRSAGS